MPENDKYMEDLEARKLSRAVSEADIPGTENLMKQPADVISTVLSRILSMGNIVSIHIEIGKPLHVKFYEQTSFGKGKLNPSTTLLSPEALEDAKKK